MKHEVFVTGPYLEGEARASCRDCLWTGPWRLSDESARSDAEAHRREALNPSEVTATLIKLLAIREAVRATTLDPELDQALAYFEAKAAMYKGAKLGPYVPLLPEEA